MKRLNRWLSLGLVLILGFLLGISGFSVWDKSPAAADLVAFGFSEEDLAVLALAIRPALPPVFKVE